MSVKQLKAGAHNCFGHLSAGEGAEDSEGVLEREVLLVYTGKFESMEGPVEITEDHIDRLVANHNSYLSRAKSALVGGVALKDCPPLQLDHSTSAAMTVGRVTGLLRKGIHLDQNTGMECAAAYGRARVLGRENCEKVKDGRWIHVSVGCDFDTGKLNELSITPFPAAPSAAMLKAGKQNGETMDFITKMRQALGKLFNLSEKDSDEKATKMKARLMETEKLSAEDAEKKLSEMDDAARTKLAAECDSEPALAAAAPCDKCAKNPCGCSTEMAQPNPPANPDLDKQEKDEPEHQLSTGPAHMSAAPAAGNHLSAEQKAKFVQLASGLRKEAKGVQMQARKATLMTRLSSLRASAKITPAEIKKIDIDKLSEANDATIAAVFKSYEDREPVIMAGVFGTAKAVNLSAAVKQAKMTKLEAETRANMSLLKKTEQEKGTTRLSSATEEMSSATSPAVQREVAMAGGHDAAYGELCRMMDEGKIEDAKLGLKALMDQMLNRDPGESSSSEPGKMQTHMSALATRVETLQNQFEELVTLVGPNLGVETSEIDKGV